MTYDTKANWVGRLQSGYWVQCLIFTLHILPENVPKLAVGKKQLVTQVTCDLSIGLIGRGQKYAPYSVYDIYQKFRSLACKVLEATHSRVMVKYVHSLQRHFHTDLNET